MENKTVYWMNVACSIMTTSFDANKSLSDYEIYFVIIAHRDRETTN